MIYAQTDSIFMHLPSASTAEAIRLGQAAGRLVTAAFPPEMELKFEKVCQPFLLLHVNRWVRCAGCTALGSERGMHHHRPAACSARTCVTSSSATSTGGSNLVCVRQVRWAGV